MDSLCTPLAAHHTLCDEAWAEAERAALEGDWGGAAASLRGFILGMAAHLGAEETLLFPAFEQATGIRAGPTEMMRMEHDHLRGLFERLEAAVIRRDAGAFAGAGETMLILMQQHNLKEERMLYPMCDQVLGGDAQLRSRLGAALQRQAA
jgi:iron-sulfur cluster repair protein YtfE (RIC family)